MCTNLQVQVHQIVLVELVDALQRLPDQTGDLGLRQQLVRHAVVKYLPTCRAGQRRHAEIHSQYTIQPEADWAEPPIKRPRGAEPPAASMKGSLKVHVHTEIHDGSRISAGFNTSVLPEGIWINLRARNLTLLPVSVSPGRATASSTSTHFQFYCVLDQQMHNSEIVPHPLSLDCSECNETNDVMKLFKYLWHKLYGSQ